MTVEEVTRLETPPSPKRQPLRPSGWKVAVAAAAALVVAVVGFSLATGGDDVAVESNLEIAQRFVELTETGDVAAYEVLLASDALAGDEPFFGPPAAAWAYGSRFQAAVGGTHTVECSEVTDSPTVEVVCALARSNRFREAAGLDPDRPSWSFGMEDGVITRLTDDGGDLLFPAFDQIIVYDAWVQANYPDEYDGLMGIPQFILDLEGAESQDLLPMPLVGTATQVARHDQLTAEWLASPSQ